MATLASISSHSCEATPPFLRLPLIISESLRSAISSDGPSTQGIVSILLSAADLAKLDLSKLQLFSVDGRVIEPAASMASSEVSSSQAEIKIVPDNGFSFQTPLILSPVADLPPGAIAFPVLKSKGVVEAEKACTQYHLLKLGAVSPSRRARKKAISMDEISLFENLGSHDIGVSRNVAEESKGGVDIDGARVRARRQLPELELAKLLCPGLEQRAEALKRKHFERVLNRTLSEVRGEEAKIDLKASPAAKFLLQVMPWELKPPVTPVTTPAGIPFIWEDVPGQPKPRALPAPCPSLPLPPRLLPGPLPSSSAVSAAGTWACPSSDFSEFLPHVDGKQSSPAKRNPHHGLTHRKKTHSWHVLHNLFSGGYQRCQSHAADALLEAHTPTGELKDSSVAGGKTSGDGVSSRSTSANFSTSSDLSPSTATALEDVFSSRESSLGACYELPPKYVAPVVPLTPPHRDFGLLEDACGKQTNRLGYLAGLFRLEKCQGNNISRTGSLFNLSKKHVKVTSESNSYLLDDANGGQTTSGGVHTDECSPKEATSDTRKQSVSGQMSPIAASLYRSPKPRRPRILIGSGRMKVFLKLRRRGARVIVASYRAVKRALFLRRASHSKLFVNHPYHTLHR